MKNHRIVITRHGGPEVLAFIEEELADPVLDEVQLRVLASGVAYGDVIKREAVVSQSRLPFTPGYDLIGTVVKGGSRFAAGQRLTGWIKNGGHAEYANIRENLLVPVPAEVDTLEALSLVLNYVTVHQMLHRIAKVRSGETILVHGAAGGVGTALLELARLAGLRALGTASLGKHALVRELGGEPIDYKSEDFVVRVRELTAGEGVAAVFDPIGGAHLARSFAALGKQRGRLVCYGVSEALSTPGARRRAVIGTVGRLLLYKAFGFGRRVYFYGIGSSRHSFQPKIQEDLSLLLDLLRDKRIKPIIGARFPLAQARQAHELMERAGTIGKIVLDHFTS